jgi:HEAT repeat protein
MVNVEFVTQNTELKTQNSFRAMPKETIETLISELVHEEDWRRMRATAACLSGGPRAVQALVQALQTGSLALKAEVAAMLARVNDPQAGVPLVGLLRDEDAAVRKAGASALEHMAGEDALGHLA